MTPDSYQDIIGLQRPRTGNHHPMSLEARAAQFAPFAALTGHDAALAETARLTDSRPEITDHEAAILSQRLSAALADIHCHPTLRVTYFRADMRKSGGVIAYITGHLTKYDEYLRQIKIGDTTMDIADILSIESD